jgi:hypothetical protein
MIGLHLECLAMAWSAFACLPRVRWGGVWQRFHIGRESVLLLVVAAIHAYALRFLLLRYY